jgi:hypothetical protein
VPSPILSSINVNNPLRQQRMVLHVVWSHTRQQLMLWVENADALRMMTAERSRANRYGHGDRPAHPFALPYPKSLLDALSINSRSHVEQLALRLPSSARAPHASPELTRLLRRDSTLTGLREWTVGSVPITHSEINDLLRAINAQQVFAVGSTVRYFYLLSQMARELVMTGNVLPQIAPAPSPVACWQPVISPVVASFCEQTAAAMPHLARAETASQPPPAEQVAHDFLRAAVDGHARKLLTAADWQSLCRANRVPSSPTSTWAKALGRQDPKLPDNGRYIAMANTLAEWAQPTDISHAVSVRMRLHPPEADPVIAQATGTSSDWWLDCTLVCDEDGEITLPANAVADSNPLAQAFEQATGTQPRAALQTLLADAARIFEPLTQIAIAPAAGGVDLTLEQVAGLFDKVNDLARQRCQLIVPEELRTPAKLSAKLRLSSDEQTSSGIITLDGLLSYSWEVDVEGVPVDISSLQRLADMANPVIQEDNAWIRLDREELLRLLNFFRGRAVSDTVDAMGALRLAAGADMPELSGEVSVQIRGWLDDFLAGDTEKRLEPVDTPNGFTGELWDVQKEGVAWLWFLDQLGLGACLADDMGVGKSGSVDSRLLTPDGWVRMGDIQLGDQVVGSDGRPHNVVGVYPQGEREVFKVSFSDGSSTECCDEHLWAVNSPVRKRRGNPPLIKQLSEIRTRTRDAAGNACWYIPLTEAVQFERREPLPLDPWLLGTLIGDGSYTGSGVSFAKNDPVLLEHLDSVLPEAVRRRTHPTRDRRPAKDHSLAVARSAGRGENPLINALRDLGMWGQRSWEKRVPERYLCASPADRLAVLQGLMDTDGEINRRGTTPIFGTSSERLLEDVVFLVQSLGGVARRQRPRIPTYTYRGRRLRGRMAYRVSVSLPDGMCPFLASHKVQTFQPKTKYRPSRAIVSVEPVGIKECQCIATDAPDQLYLTDEFIVTHNTPQTISLLLTEREHYEARVGQLNAQAAGGVSSPDPEVLLQDRVSDSDSLPQGTVAADLEVPADAANAVPDAASASAGSAGNPTRALPDPPGPTLLIMPMSCVSNWEEELAKFAPSLRVHVHHGADRHTADEIVDIAHAHDVVLTTYDLALRDLDVLRALTWHRLVLDEAQHIKNMDTQQTQVINQIPARNRVALTGTPIENRLAELWSIFNFLNPGLLGTWPEFRERFVIPIEQHQDEEAARVLRELISPFILRRLKTDPRLKKYLPEKVEKIVPVPLTPEQIALYEAVVEEGMRMIASAPPKKRRGLILKLVAQLKQVCNHPAHLLKDGSRFAGRSGKVAYIEERFQKVRAAGEKLLIFTQYAEFGTPLAEHLQDLFGGRVEFFHGGLSARKRQALRADFQDDPDFACMVISLKAGGAGLNLVAASNVIHADRWWNPAVEDQATDRAYRGGQTRDVLVEKLVCRGTFEDRIDELIESKRGLQEMIVGVSSVPEQVAFTEMSTRELRAAVSLSAQAVEEQWEAEAVT